MTVKTEILREIFENFICLEENFIENEMWKSQAIIKLMDASNVIHDKQLFEAGLMEILSLCRFKDGGHLTDSYESESCSINNLSESDKNMVNSILKEEFT
ncbi:MAG: hypothetical protein ACW986_12920 [Promethearchaeota archaeon]